MKILPENRYLLDNPSAFKRSYVRNLSRQLSNHFAGQNTQTQNDQSRPDTFSRRAEKLPTLFDILGQDDFERSQSPRLPELAFDDDEPLFPDLSPLSESGPEKEQFSELTGPTTVEFPGREPLVLPALNLERRPENQSEHLNPFGMTALLEQASPRRQHKPGLEKDLQAQEKPEAEPFKAEKPLNALTKRRTELAIKRKALLEDYTLGETDTKKLAEIHEVTPRHARDWVQKFWRNCDADSSPDYTPSRPERKKRASRKRRAAEENRAFPSKRLAHGTNRQTKTSLIAFNPETNALEVERPASHSFQRPIVQTGDAESPILHFMPGLPNAYD